MSNYISPPLEDVYSRLIKLIDHGKGAELIMAVVYAMTNSQVFLTLTNHNLDDLSHVYPLDGLWLKYLLTRFGSSKLDEYYLSRLNDSHPNANTKFREFMNQLDEVVPMACPKTGEFFGYKKAYLYDYDMAVSNTENRLSFIVVNSLSIKSECENAAAKECIVKLLIPNDAKRSSSFGGKCRCSKAKVISIQTINGEDVLPETEARSQYNIDFKYKLGEWVVPEHDFDENRWNECASGIHFFMTEKEAIDY